MATNTTTTKINEDSHAPKLPPIFAPIPARWGYLPGDTDCNQQARPGQRVGTRAAREKVLTERLIACLVALPLATLALVAICMAVVMGADTPEDHSEPRSAAAFGWEVSR